MSVLETFWRVFTVIPNNSEQNKRTILMPDGIVGSCIQHKGGLIVSCTLFHNFKLFKYKNKVMHTSVFPMQWKAKMKSPCSNINHKRELLNTGCDFSSSNDLRVWHFIFCVAGSLTTEERLLMNIITNNYSFFLCFMLDRYQTPRLKQRH